MSSKPRSNPPALPSGTVTFLFTDVEGSTRLWATQHDAMRTSLARHDALLRQCIEAHGGHVFKTGGDAFCAAFATATGAVEAALDAQRALRAERWPEQAAIRSRMALHTGAAEIRDGDYFGPPLTDTDAAGSAYQIAEGHAYRNEADLAFQWMERAYAQHDPGLISMKVDPLLRRLHDDSRWQPFLEKMGLVG